ncbi:MAG: tRNA (adenosine(37)-N6)-threonylcarbamoyltransferase complex transferase subunit TsaD [Candidatus Babeliales bacterium]
MKIVRTILGIETSCDETAAAVYDAQQGILSSVLFSQTDIHKLYGGVVPELASRSHLEKINAIVHQALEQSHKSLNDIDVIAVTNKPGLPGSLLIGVCFAKALAYALNTPIIGIDHIEGHIFSPFLSHPNIPFPHICLTASGGHTSIFLVKDFGNYELLGTTRDDAAGEAFDKIAKLMELPYPGGPVIEKLAAQVNFYDSCNYPRTKLDNLDFSFSGLKTAVLYDLVAKNAYDMQEKKFLRPHDDALKQEVSSSLLVCITDIFKNHIKKALIQYPQTQAITLVGGVACNKYIRKECEELCQKLNRQFFVPVSKYCTDNAAMIALVGAYKATQGKFSTLELDILT